jgi:hypothetical protein
VLADIALTGGPAPGACGGTANRSHHPWVADAGAAGCHVGAAGCHVGAADAAAAGADTRAAGAGAVGGAAGAGAAGAFGRPADRSHHAGAPGEEEDSTFIPYGGGDRAS